MPAIIVVNGRQIPTRYIEARLGASNDNKAPPPDNGGYRTEAEHDKWKEFEKKN